MIKKGSVPISYCIARPWKRREEKKRKGRAVVQTCFIPNAWCASWSLYVVKGATSAVRFDTWVHSDRIQTSLSHTGIPHPSNQLTRRRTSAPPQLYHDSVIHADSRHPGHLTCRVLIHARHSLTSSE